MNRYVLLGLAALIIYTSNIWGTSIYILDEAKNASCAMEMLQRSDFIVPTFNGELRTDKPPLHYYFMMIAYTVFGVSPLSARLFSALAGVAMVMFMYHKLSKLVNEQVACYSALITMASLQLTVQFHMAVPDPYLILWLTVSFISFYELHSGKQKAFFPFYISLALGFLTKGLIAFVFPVLVALVFMLFARSFQLATFKRLQLIRGTLIFLLLAMPWYWAVGVATDGQWLRGFFIEHNVNRYTSTMEGHRGLIFSPALFLLAGLFPFSVFAFHAVYQAFKKRGENEFIFYCLAVVVVVVLFFSFSRTLLPGYIAPAIPFMAALLGWYSVKHLTGIKSTGYFSLAVLLISILIPVVAYYVLASDEQVAGLKHYAYGFMVIPFSAYMGWRAYRNGSVSRLIISWTAGCLLASLFFFYFLYPALDKLNPVVTSASLRREYNHYQPVAYGLFNPAFVFDYGKPILKFDSPAQLKAFIGSENRKILIITRRKYLNELTPETEFAVIYRSRDLFERSETVLLIN